MPTSDDRYLHRAASSLPYFSADGEAYLTPTPLRDLKKVRPLRVLSEADFAFWQTYGYVVVREAIPAEAAQQLLDFAWDFQGLDPDRPETWYEEQSFRSELEQELHVYGFVEAYQHQLIWDSRQAQRVYDAFVDVWDCEELWVTLDRLNLNPPNVRTRDRALIAPTDKGFDIELHWDVDSTLSVLPQRVQGIIALNDTRPELGGFQCNPELFRRFEQWRMDQPADRDPIRPAVDREEFPVVRPELKAGDLLIWNGMLAHGVARNTSEDGVRSVQYLSMMPALEEAEEMRRSRIESWRTLSTPTWNRTLVGDAKRHESLRYGAAELTGLGEKLLGLRSWNATDAKPADIEASSGGRSCDASA
ncbi:phytanoyl-CoA dioxygenase family protein [Kitasatospora sp. NBC_01250]|uniref:phytanoyl-CoA dioxygenase family protein n=1 Tax=unclassified Kitasatospora TaxID=2633591 RepID=UPI002E125133|nr:MULTISPECIES: phytanoyl-CoA dioxygenase family protein [unclassified Kitasatospora]WSJ69211.1 phytanoyl-CoA dioxygenase family protein [Kitasatospora sp. NBC_01302]